MSMEPNEPKYLPIPFAPGYMVSRDGTVARRKPYRVISVLPFHDVRAEAARHSLYRIVATNPEALDASLVWWEPARFFTTAARSEWMRWAAGLARHHVPLIGDIRSGWVRVDIPMGGDVECCGRLLMHGPSVAAFMYDIIT
jgi:hypothetical protein